MATKSMNAYLPMLIVLLLLGDVIGRTSAELDDVFVVVFNMLQADLSRSTSSLIGGELKEDTCGGILNEFGSCDVEILPNYNGNVSYSAFWTGLGSSPFGFKLTADPEAFLPVPVVTLVNTNEPRVYLNSSSKLASSTGATVCVAFCSQQSCPYCF